MRKITITAAALLASLGLLTGCSMAYENSSVEPLITADVGDSENVLEALEQADEIVLQKHAISFNDVYDVSADGVELGEIRGQYIYALGDTFSLFSEADNLVGSEGEGFRVTTHNAELFDYYNEPAGKIQENFSWPLTHWTILDASDEPQAEASQNLSFTLSFDVNDMLGNPQYRIDKSFLSFGSKLTITRISNEPTVDALSVVWLAAIANEIDEAAQESDSN